MRHGGHQTFQFFDYNIGRFIDKLPIHLHDIAIVWLVEDLNMDVLAYTSGT